MTAGKPTAFRSSEVDLADVAMPSLLFSCAGFGFDNITLGEGQVKKAS
jgi:hypothetical protein